MPHLLSLNSYHYRRGGSDVVYFDHANLFEEKGWDNTFFSMHHPRNLDTPDAAHFARMVDYEFAGGGMNKIRTALASVYNVEARKKLRFLLKQGRFDIAHVHCLYHHLTPSVFPVLHAAGIPIVLTAHDLKIACPAYKMMNGTRVCEDCKGGDLTHVVRNRCIKGSAAASGVVMAEAMLHRALGSYRKYISMVVAPSQFYRDKIIEWGWPEERITYVPNFTRTIDPSFEQDYSGPILFFGRLSDEKGLGTLIEAARVSGVPVDIAGTGPLEDSLKTQAHGAPVRFLGRLDGDHLWETVGRARAIALPSQWYENAPMSVLEAYQLRRPVIGADIGGIPELVQPKEGRAGWLFPSGDSAALAQCLTDVMASSEDALRVFGEHGRQLALGRFSRDSYFNAMQALYEELGSVPAAT